MQNYPVGWAVDPNQQEPVVAYLIDLPGVAASGRSWKEAVQRLSALVPSALADMGAHGRVLPAPSREPQVTVGALNFQGWLKEQAGLVQEVRLVNA